MGNLGGPLLPVPLSRIVIACDNDLPKSKIDRMNAIGQTVGGVRWAPSEVRDDEVPVLGCMPAWRGFILERQAKGLPWAYMDSGYFCRRNAKFGRGGTTILMAPTPELGRYRIVVNGFQVTQVRNRPQDRFLATGTPIKDWRHKGRHVVIAAAPSRYVTLHAIEWWLEWAIAQVKAATDRQIRVRYKADGPLNADLAGAWALVTHGSMAAVEAIFNGIPAFVYRGASAAEPVAVTDLAKIEEPIMPDRSAWAASLAYEQWTTAELFAGTAWRELGLAEG